MHWQLHKTATAHYREYKRRGERMPVAIALGGDPALTYCASAPLPPNVDEYLFAGFLRGEAVRMVKGVATGLDVPADADLVIEGFVDTTAPLVREGPFGDHTGFYSLADDYPALDVVAVTHRRDAVYPATVVGPPPVEDQWLGKATERIFLPMLQMIFPEIVDMAMPVEGVFHNLCLLSIKKEHPGQAKKVIHGLWGSGQMAQTKTLVVFDDDVDVQDAPPPPRLGRDARAAPAGEERPGPGEALVASPVTGHPSGGPLAPLSRCSRLPIPARHGGAPSGSTCARRANAGPASSCRRPRAVPTLVA